MEHQKNIIIGAGPAGLQLADLFQRRQEPYLMLERAACAGSFFERYPRHNKLLSINKVYTGCSDIESRRRYDWNSLVADEPELQFEHYSREYFPTASELVRYLRDFAEKRGLAIRYNASVTSVSRAADGYRLKLADGSELGCERLFIATGTPHERLPEVPGVALCETYGGASIDPQDYRDQRVLIVGKGNSAFETADNLIATTRKLWVCGSHTVRLAWATHFVGDLRAVNNNFLDTYQLKAQNNILDGELVKVARDGDELVATLYFEARKRSYDFPCDRVLLCTGFKFDDAIFADNCKPALSCGGKVPEMNAAWESTSAPNMFFAGTLMQARDFRKTMSAFIHGFRHNIVALDQILQQRDGAAVWQDSLVLPRTLDALAETIIAQLSTSAAVLLQPGFLVDIVGLTADGAVRYLKAVPLDYARETMSEYFHRMLAVSLEYKLHDGLMDPFAMPRGRGVEEDYYLHPIVRVFEGEQQVARTFLPDDLDNDWRNEPSHQQALIAFLAEQRVLSQTSSPGPAPRQSTTRLAVSVDAIDNASLRDGDAPTGDPDDSQTSAAE